MNTSISYNNCHIPTIIVFILAFPIYIPINTFETITSTVNIVSFKLSILLHFTFIIIPLVLVPLLNKVRSIPVFILVFTLILLLILRLLKSDNINNSNIITIMKLCEC